MPQGSVRRVPLLWAGAAAAAAPAAAAGQAQAQVDGTQLHLLMRVDVERVGGNLLQPASLGHNPAGGSGCQVSADG